MASEKTDHWSHSSYQASASFVPKLTSKVLQLLDPQPNDRILDIGCGDGILTSQIAQAVLPQGFVLGLDSSSSFIDHARSTYQISHLAFQKQDCTQLEKLKFEFPKADERKFNKVFSNAALHWILRDPSTRLSTLQAIHDLLQPGGTFAFEMGGAGNVCEVHAALIYALVSRGVSPVAVRSSSPWYFPSSTEMSSLLSQAGFEVKEEDIELDWRPTKMEEQKSDTPGEGGIEGWVRLMGATFLEQLPEQTRGEAIVEIVQVLKDITARDGGQWLNYVRCRGVARRKV